MWWFFFFLNLQMLSVLFALISEMVLVEMKFPQCLVVALYQVHSVFMLFFTQTFFALTMFDWWGLVLKSCYFWIFGDFWVGQWVVISGTLFLPFQWSYFWVLIWMLQLIVRVVMISLLIQVHWKPHCKVIEYSWLTLLYNCEGSLTLVGGDPGVGKSTLLLQAWIIFG